MLYVVNSIQGNKVVKLTSVTSDLARFAHVQSRKTPILLLNTEPTFFYLLLIFTVPLGPESLAAYKLFSFLLPFLHFYAS